MKLSPSSTVPPVGLTIPITALMNVLFPLPFGPTMPTSFPPSATSDISCTTGTGPYPAMIPLMFSRALRPGEAVTPPADPLGETGLDLGEIGFNDLLVLSQLLHASLGRHPALDHYQHPRTEPIDDFEIVFDDQQRHVPPFVDVPDSLDQPIHHDWSDARHRLIQQQDLRIGHQGPGQLKQPLLAAAQVSGVLVGERQEAELLQQGARLDQQP